MQNVQLNRRRFLQAAGASSLLGNAGAISSMWAAQSPASDCCAASPHRMVENMEDPQLINLITLDPAHFHAALAQKQMLPGISPRVSIFAPLGPDLLAHLKLIEGFNSRADNPTHWELDIHCSPHSLEEMIAAKPGNVVVLAGRNRIKIGKINASLEAGLNVLSDKPWIIRAEDLKQLEHVLALADEKGLVAYDMMTERHEITTILQRELVNDPAVFGAIIPADRERPGVFMESTHHILKTVAGTPNLRPPFFFDILDEGEGLTDVGTHLVDLVQWTLFPDQAVDYQRDIQVQSGKRWATPISAAQFKQVTGVAAFPSELASYVHGNTFDYYCNNQVDYKIRGAQVQLNVMWKWESAAGVDYHHAVYRGTKSSVEIRQSEKENYRPELFVSAAAGQSSTVADAVRSRIDRLQGSYPGVAVQSAGEELHIIIPDRYRVGHEAHFAQVVAEFMKYFNSPKSLPAWERPNMMAKYYVTTTGVQLGHRG